MSDLPARAGRNPLRHLAVLAVLATVIVVAIFVTLRVVFDQKHALVVRAWEQRIGSPDDLGQRYPARPVNASALRVEQLGAALGIDMAPRWAEGRARPSGEQKKAHQRVLPHHYLRKQIERDDTAIDAPPADLVDFLAAHAGTLEALRGHLLTAEPPRWEFALETQNVGGTTLPNLLGHINTQKLLLSDALARTYAGDHREALRSVEASWRLGTAIDDDPVLITQLIAVAGSRLRCGVLRKIPNVPDVWRHRLLAQDYRATFLDAMRLEGWYWLQIADRQPMELAQNAIERPLIFEAAMEDALGWIARPYVRACAADMAEEYQRHIVELGRLDQWCDEDLSGNLPLRTAWWNRLVGALGGIGDAPARLARLEIDLELTRLILASRAGTGLETEIPSRACPQDRWIRRLDPAGTFTIELSRPVEWPDPSGPILPTRYSFPAPPSLNTGAAGS